MIDQTADGKKTEEVEGLDDERDISGEYPIDTVLIRNESRTVHDVLRRIEQQKFVMDPDFQRDFIWKDEKQCRLVESVMMRIPLPVFYLAENNDGDMIVVDGLQRLSTFRRFANNELRLKLPRQSALDSKYFRDLPPKLQNRLEDCNLTLYIIDSKVPAQALLDIFERVNGGEPLTRQQMRNSLFHGSATRFLKVEANSDEFEKATTGTLDKKKMRDRELINRFCAFKIFDLQEYKGDMDDFLATALKRMNEMEDLTDLSNKFRLSMMNNWNVFRNYSFRKHGSQSESRRNMINASLWDVMSVGLSRYDKSMVDRKKSELQVKFYDLMDSHDFIEAITLGTGEVRRVRQRFDIINTALKEVFGD